MHRLFGVYRMNDRDRKLDCDALPAVEVSDVLSELVRYEDIRKKERYLHVEKVPNAEESS